jgi:hypothetical protein
VFSGRRNPKTKILKKTRNLPALFFFAGILYKQMGDNEILSPS